MACANPQKISKDEETRVSFVIKKGGAESARLHDVIMGLLTMILSTSNY